MINLNNEISKFILSILAQFGSVLIITAAFIKYFGNKFIDNLFQKKIKEYELKINLKFDKVSQVNRKVFDILPKMWDLTIDVWHKIFGISLPVTDIADLTKMSEDETRDFLKDNKYNVYDISKILTSTDKQKTYSSIKYIYDYKRFVISFKKMEDYYFTHKLFIAEDTSKIIDKIRNLFNECKLDMDMYIKLSFQDNTYYLNPRKRIIDNENFKTELSNSIKDKLNLE